MESSEGLGIIPVDILKQGTKEIANYFLDLFRSPEADPLYRSKLMVVGFQNVGKTTILDCVFPMLDLVETEGGFFSRKKSYWLKLEGNHLSKFEHKMTNILTRIRSPF